MKIFIISFKVFIIALILHPKVTKAISWFHYPVKRTNIFKLMSKINEMKNLNKDEVIKSKEVLIMKLICSFLRPCAQFLHDELVYHKRKMRKKIRKFIKFLKKFGSEKTKSLFDLEKFKVIFENYVKARSMLKSNLIFKYVFTDIYDELDEIAVVNEFKSIEEFNVYINKVEKIREEVVNYLETPRALGYSKKKKEFYIQNINQNINAFKAAYNFSEQ